MSGALHLQLGSPFYKRKTLSLVSQSGPWCLQTPVAWPFNKLWVWMHSCCHCRAETTSHNKYTDAPRLRNVFLTLFVPSPTRDFVQIVPRRRVQALQRLVEKNNLLTSEVLNQPSLFWLRNKLGQRHLGREDQTFLPLLINFRFEADFSWMRCAKCYSESCNSPKQFGSFCRWGNWGPKS